MNPLHFLNPKMKTMINQIKIKLILVHFIYLAGILFLTSSCSENKTVDSMKVAEQENIGKLVSDNETIMVVEKDYDAEFLMDVAEMQLEEISLGKLAQKKGNSSHVKALGKMMEEDHTKSLADLKVLAQSKSVSIPTSITEDSKEVYDDLEDKSGNDFDKAYSDMMVEHHEDAIELFEEAAIESKDAEIRSWATKKLPGLRTHLKHAEACKKEVDILKS